MAIKFSNLASTTLASGVSSTATSVSVTSASSFPTLGSGDYFYATIGAGSGSEIVKVTGISGTTFTVSRGEDGTTAVSHSAGVDVALRVTAGTLEDLRDGGQVYTAGSGLGLSGNEFTNTAPDQTVSISGSGSTTVTGTYPSFTVSSTSYSHPSAHPISFITGLQTALDGKVDDSQVLTNVPSGALFTDTVYTLPFTDNSTNWNTAYGWGDHSTGGYLTSHQSLSGYATETYVGTQISNLVDSSPAALNTLNELAAALGDDPNFATTVTTSIGTKLPLAGGTLTGALSGTTATFSGNVNAESDIRVGTAAGAINQTGIIKENGSAYGLGLFTWGDTAPVQIGGGSLNLQKEVGGGVDLKINGTTVIDSSRDLFARQGAFTHDDHNYVKIENTAVAKEQMVRFRNSQTNYWYAGIRTSAGIASTADFHIYSTAHGDDVFALTTSGDLVAKRNLNTKTGSIQINGTTVIDSSRNLTNLGTIAASGQVTVLGTDVSLLAQKNVSTGWSGRIISSNATTGVASFLGNYNGYAGVFAHNSSLSAWAPIYINTHSSTGAGAANVYLGTTYINGNTAWHAGNDGSGSGLDADTVDGIQASSFLRTDANDTASGQYSFTKVNDHAIRVGTIRGTVVGSQSGEYIQMYNRVNIGSPQGWGSRSAPTYGLSVYGSAEIATDTGTLTRAGHLVWDAGNDGSGSGLDADLLDGSNSGAFLKTGAGDSVSGWWISAARNGNSGSPQVYFSHSSGYGQHINTYNTNGGVYALELHNNVKQLFAVYNDGAVHANGGNVVWHAGNDGSGSGLDADLLDGIHASGFIQSGGSWNASNMPGSRHAGISANSGEVVFQRDNPGTGQMSVLVDGNFYAGETNGFWSLYSGNNYNAKVGMYSNSSGHLLLSTSSAYAGGNKIWHAGNDGSGSGLDADLLDGKDHTNFGATLATFGTTGGAGGRIRCTAPFDTNSGHMFQVTVSLYTSYEVRNYVVAGYMYPTTNQWHSPTAIYSGAGTPDIKVGRDSNGKAYISIAKGSYTGVRVHNMTRGYFTSVADTYDPWTITENDATENSVTPTVSKTWHSTNDGSGSGLDADLLDGQQGSYYAPASHVHSYLPLAGGTITGNLNVNGTTTLGNGNADQTHINDTLYLGATDSGDSHFYFGENSSNWYGDHWYWDSGYEVERYSRYAGTDTLIEKHDTRYTHKVQTNRAYERLGHASGYQIGSYNSVAANSDKTNPIYTIGDAYRPSSTSVSGMYGIGYAHSNLWGTGSGKPSGWGQYIVEAGTYTQVFSVGGTWSLGEFNRNGNKVWDAGNDGSGSGLDADLLDGIDSSRVVYGDNATGSTSNQNPNNTLKSGFFDTYNNNTPSATWYSMFHSRHNNVGNNHGHQIAGSFYDNNLWNRNINNGSFGAWNKNWSSNNDGSGSGLDADTVDGIQGASLLRSDADDSFTGALASTARNNGIFGIYDSTKTDHIWSMGTSYRNHSAGANFGNLYGLAYKHTNNGTGGTMASGHMMVWCQNGTPYAAMGTNIWTSGSVNAASFLYNSDRAFKTNIKPIKNALSTVLSLSGVSYTLKKSGKNTTGFIAQEVEKVLPDMVDGDEGEKGVNYGQMVALLTEAMREQQNLIVSLQKEIQELKDATK